MSLALQSQHAEMPGIAELAEVHPRRRRIHPAVLYCLAVVLVPVLAVPFFIWLGSSNFFLHHGASAWVQSNDSIFNVHDRQCDVLVFGDSTAMTGIDPELLNRYTGFHTCNISVTNAVLAVTGNLALDQYLQHNPRPRMLVVQLSPDDFQQGNRVWNHTIYAEGLLELLRHGTPQQAHAVLLSHPREAIAFAGYAAGYSAYYALKDVWFRATHLRPEEDEIRVNNGFFTPPAPARTACERTDSQPADASAAFARSITTEYEQRYGAQNGSVVLVDVAPIPSCDGNLAVYSQQLNGVTNNKLEALPIQLFNDGRHYTAFGSRVVSALVARQVNQVARQFPSLDDRTPSPSSVAALHPVAVRH